MSAIVDKRPPGSPKTVSPKQAPKSPPKAPKSPPKPPSKAKSPPGSPDSKKNGEKSKRRGRASRAAKKEKEKQKAAEDAAVKSSFDCSSAIANVSENLWVSAVSGTKMGASLEATLLECGVTSIVSTIDKPTQNENFTQLDVDTSHDECSPNLHEACDFISEQIECGGSVFVHSRSGFARSEWAVLIVLGYMVKYDNKPLMEAIEALFGEESDAGGLLAAGLRRCHSRSQIDRRRSSPPSRREAARQGRRWPTSPARRR